MTQEEKQLLLVDLCARLPYGVVVSKKPINESFTWQELQDFQYGKIYKPYLRPSWKPSEEQIEAIENVIKCELSAGLHTRANILQTLQNELKKL